MNTNLGSEIFCASVDSEILEAGYALSFKFWGFKVLSIEAVQES